jgi:hypothetical protein
MARTNLSLGNLFRAVSGSVRSGQASIGQFSGNSANSAFSSFATDAITVTVPTFTYIVESTTENAQFSFTTTGSLFYSKVQQVINNYTCSFNSTVFAVGTRTYATGPSIFPITPNAITASTYSEASASLTMNYADGYNVNATNYNTPATKTLYAVDVYNTVNQPDFCLLFGTQIELESGTLVDVEDLNVGDVIKAWVPAGLPDESQDIESDQLDWRFYMLDGADGSAQNVTVKDITFNFAEGYFSLNNGLIKATGTHPLWIWDVETNKYHFKAIQDILIGDKLIKYDETNGVTEIEIYDIAVIKEDIEIVTINVENADVFLSNGIVSHNKGTATQPYIPSSGLRMYLDPSKASSFPGGSLPATGTPTTDYLDLGGYGTGFRPAAQGYSGTSPSYNNGATRIDKYFTLNGSSTWWQKDRTSNINGGISQFDVSALTFVAWVRQTANQGASYGGLFSKEGADRDYNFYLYSSTATAWDGFHFSSARGSISNPVQTFTAPALNTWHMVGFTISAAAGIAYYLNGSSVGTGTMSAFAATTAYDIKLGRADNYANCQLGPVLFYNRVLTSTEITQVYNYFQPTYRP